MNKDPLQARLEEMEKNNPSKNNHPLNFFQALHSKLHFFRRALGGSVEFVLPKISPYAMMDYAALDDKVEFYSEQIGLRRFPQEIEMYAKGHEFLKRTLKPYNLKGQNLWKRKYNLQNAMRLKDAPLNPMLMALFITRKDQAFPCLKKG